MIYKNKKTKFCAIKCIFSKMIQNLSLLSDKNFLEKVRGQI
jgi:hypothetical protein